MLTVVSQEGESWIFVNDFCLEHVAVPGDHLIEAPRLIDDVRKLHWLDHAASRSRESDTQRNRTVASRETPELQRETVAVSVGDVAQIACRPVSAFHRQLSA